MAFTVTTRGTNDNGTGASVATISVGPFTPAATSLLLGFLMAEEDSDTPNNVNNFALPVGGSLTWSSVQVIEGVESIPNGAPGNAEYQKRAGLWRATVTTPSSMSVTFDGSTGSGLNCWYSAGCLDITGHDTTTPVVQSVEASFNRNGAAGGSLSATLPGALTTGNLVVACFSASVIGGSAMAAPTLGGQTMTLVQSNAPNDYEQHVVYQRTITGAESNATVTCSNMGGTQVYGEFALAVEIAAEPGAAPTPTTGTAAFTTDDVTVAGVGNFTPFGGGSAAFTTANSTILGVGTRTIPAITGAAAFTTATVTVAGIAAVPASWPWPTAISANSRYIEDQFGNPWFGVGNSLWSMVAQLTYAEITSTLEDQAARGINLILTSIPEPHYVSNPFTDTRNVYNEEPFNGTPFSSSLNEDYWLVADHYVSEAQRVGITLLWVPAYLGFEGGNDGWSAEVAAVTNAQMTAYGNTIAARYASYPNIIWLIGHDRDPNATDEARSKALADAIQAGTSHLLTVGSVQQEGGGVSDIGSVAWASANINWDFDTIYDYSQLPAAGCQAGWALTSPVRPIGFLEGKYEQEQEYEASLDDEPIFRSQLYGPLCSGACYAIYGNNPLWHFESPAWTFYTYQGTWESNLNSPVAQKMAIFASFVDSLNGQWAEMTPDMTDTFLTVGEGSGVSQASARFSTVLTSGTVAVAYRPHGGAATLTFDMSELAPDEVDVRKFDPVSGISTSLGVFATSGTQSFGSLGTNAGGDGDWVLAFTVIPEGPYFGASVINAVRHGINVISKVFLGTLQVFGSTADTGGAPAITGTAAITTAGATVAGAGNVPTVIMGTGAITTADSIVQMETIVTTTVAHWHEEAAGPYTSSPWLGSVVEFEGAAYRENARVTAGQHRYTYTADTDPGGTHRKLYCYTGSWVNGMTIRLVSGTALKIIEWKRGAEAWRETVLNTVGNSHTINLSDTTTGPIMGPGPTPSSGWDCVLLERDDIAAGSFTAALTNFYPVTLPPTSIDATSGNTVIDITYDGPYPNFEVRVNSGSWVSKGATLTHQFTGLTNGVSALVEVRATSQYGASTAISDTATPAAFPTGPAAFTTDDSTIVASGSVDGGAAFDPLTALAWAAVFWAGDPAVTAPSDGANVTAWNQPGSYTTGEWTVDGTPTYIASWSNGKPAIEFLQAERLECAFSSTNVALVTVIIIGETTDTESDLIDDPVAGATERLLLDRSGTAWRMYRGSLRSTAAVANGSPHFFQAGFYGADSYYYLAVDGVERIDDAGVTGAQINKAIAIGSSNSNAAHTKCKVAFVGVYLGDVTAEMAAPLLAWSQTHYGTP